MINRTPFIIAELSGNHGGKLGTMLVLIDEAAYAGCDAIKFQYYQPEQMPDYAGNEALYQECRVPAEWLPAMFARAHDRKTTLFASVFSLDAMADLNEFRPLAYKIASPESTRLPFDVYKALTKRVRDLGAMLIVSSGIADMGAMQTLEPDCLMYCKKGYPATIDNIDLQYVHWLQSDLPGFSDHTPDIISPLAMITAGAKVIEKHFKLDESAVDAAFSLNPIQMNLLCNLAHR